MRASSRFRNPGIVPVVFMLVSVSMLLALGAWQLQRLFWKQEVLAQVESGQQLPPLAALPPSQAELEMARYRRVALSGYFLDKPLFFRIGRHRDYTQGYYVTQPLRIEDTDQTILVNRGFVPGTQEEAAAIVAEPVAKRMVRVEGLLRPPHTARLFTPSNRPERNLWFSDDLDTMGAAVGARLQPLVVDATGAARRGTFPIPATGEVHLRNDHLGYAITWFMLAAVGIVMFGFYCRKPGN